MHSSSAKSSNNNNNNLKSTQQPPSIPQPSSLVNNTNLFSQHSQNQLGALIESNNISPADLTLFSSLLAKNGNTLPGGLPPHFYQFHQQLIQHQHQQQQIKLNTSNSNLNTNSLLTSSSTHKKSIHSKQNSISPPPPLPPLPLQTHHIANLSSSSSLPPFNVNLKVIYRNYLFLRTSIEQ